MGLEQYWKKRSFENTPEPRGITGKSGEKLSFVVQKHAASHLHYDFRLEIDGTLKSWAIPKGPSLNPDDKRLAVEVEDHPLAYGSFEGVIPANQYGGGTVMLWDRGSWIPEGDPARGYRLGRLHFQLEGEKLTGEWSLVRMRGKENEHKKNWLLIKIKDKHARLDQEADITSSAPKSVLTGREMDEIAAYAAPPKKPQASQPKTAPKEEAGRAQKNHSKKLDLPRFIQPQLATLVAAPPQQGEWLSELKYDGYRILARLENKKATLWTRNQKEWTHKLPQIAADISALDIKEAWLDGELVAIDADGRSSFEILQQIFSKETIKPPPHQLLYYLFDLLMLDGEDLRHLSQIERKQHLHKILSQSGHSSLRYSNHIEGQMTEVFRQICQQGEEGVILKKSDAPYKEDRTTNWLKLKCGYRQEFVVGGYTEPAGSREGFGALMLGYYDASGGLVYVGRVGTGFDANQLEMISHQLKKLQRKTSPFTASPTGTEGVKAHWVRPEMVIEVRFAGWTHHDRLRQAAFTGIRQDKSASEVHREKALSPPKTAPSKHSANTGVDETLHPPNVIAGVTITHPSRVVFAENTLTKLDVVHYYERISRWILPQLKHRPLTIVRCPGGTSEPCFYQKHATGTLPDSISQVKVQEKNEPAIYMTADNLPALIELVQMGVLEFHTWGSRRDRLDRPDRMIFDLDPAPEVNWPDLVEAAQLLHALLQELKLPAFLKTTGGKGLHVEVPLQRVHDWLEIKEFSHAVADHLSRHIPERFVTTMSKTKRKGKIYIDYLRNTEGATAIVAFSTRARPGAPVATPITWEELPDVRPDMFNVSNIFDHLGETAKDPWQAYESSRVRLTKSIKQKLGIQ